MREHYFVFIIIMFILLVNGCAGAQPVHPTALTPVSATMQSEPGIAGASYYHYLISQKDLTLREERIFVEPPAVIDCSHVLDTQ